MSSTKDAAGALADGLKLERDPKRSKQKAEPYDAVYTRVADHANYRYKDLIGSVLTTLEATVDEDRKLTALRTRVKCIQGLVWEEMKSQLFDYITWYRDFKKKIHDHSEREEFLKSIVKIQFAHTTEYHSRLSNLVAAIFTDQRRIHSLNQELGKLIFTERDYMRKYAGRMICERFPVEAEAEEN